jgi:hypothetical protein
MRRVQKSLSDLDGSDALIHEGRAEGVMRELCNAFVRQRDPRPNVPQMMRNYRQVVRQLDDVLEAAGANSVFEARAFADLCFVARANAAAR